MIQIPVQIKFGGKKNEKKSVMFEFPQGQQIDSVQIQTSLPMIDCKESHFHSEYAQSFVIKQKKEAFFAIIKLDKNCF